jgi:uncharacterized membrane protein YdjX (TVP38/TMEM64 family)
MRDGAQIVLLARLSPFSPYVAMSFLFGLTAGLPLLKRPSRLHPEP